MTDDRCRLLSRHRARSSPSTRRPTPSSSRARGGPAASSPTPSSRPRRWCPSPAPRSASSCATGPASVGLLLGVLQAGGCVVTINPGRGRDRTREDIAASTCPSSPASPTTSPTSCPTGRRATTVAADRARRAARRSRRAPTTARADAARAWRCGCSPAARPARRSGSTSPTRRSSRCSSAPSTTARPTRPSTQLRRGVAIVNSPLVHLGGLFRVLPVRHRRPLVLRSSSGSRSRAGSTPCAATGPATASLVPTALRMVLEADLDPADLASLRSVVSGTAPLDPDDADAFLDALRRARARHLRGHRVRRRRGRAGTSKDHRAHWADQAGERRPGPRRVRAARGRPRHRRRRCRPTPRACSRCEAGQLGDGGWVRTTDLARIDADGFLCILGRADQAIIRGGFKVLPEDIKAALERHPAVRGAAVVGRDDRRLGAVPGRRGRAARDDATVDRRRPARLRRHACSPATSCPPRSGSSTSCPAPTPARSTSPPSRALFDGEPLMDLTLLRRRRGLPQGGAGLARRGGRRPTARRPPPGDWDARRAYDTGWQRQLHDAGYAGLNWPVEYGGRGLPATQQLVYLEEYADVRRARTSASTSSATPTPAPRSSPRAPRSSGASTCPGSCKGETVWCQGFSEPEAGSDLASLRTRAVRDGDDYVVTGQKIWSTRAHVADCCELLVRTDPDAPKHKGITWLILDMHQPGVEVRPMKTIDGESHFCEVFLDGARVPVTQPGRRGERRLAGHQRHPPLRAGHRLRPAHHHPAVPAPAPRRPAPARGAVDDAGLPAPRRPARRPHRRPVADDPAVRHRGGGHRAAVAAGLGGEARLQRARPGDHQARHAAARPAGASAPTGPTPTRPQVVHDYLWSFQYTIAAGTSQIQRNLIAERILGMPKVAMSARRRGPRGHPGARLRAVHRRAVVQRHPRRHGRRRDPRREARRRRGPLGAGGHRRAARAARSSSATATSGRSRSTRPPPRAPRSPAGWWPAPTSSSPTCRRPAMRASGLDYESLRAVKPDIILASATAYGEGGPDSDRVGFDGTGQVLSGAVVPPGPARPADPHGRCPTPTSARR